MSDIDILFIVVFIICLIGSILAGFVLDYFYRQGREEYIALDKYKEDYKK